MSYRVKAMKALAEGATTSAEVATHLGVSQKIASAVLCRMHTERRINRSEVQGHNGWRYGRKVNRPWTMSEISRLKGMEGVRASTAARRLGRSVAAVCNQARRHGVKLKGRKVKYWSPCDGVQAARLQTEGLTYKQIAEKTGVPYATLREWLVRHK